MNFVRSCSELWRILEGILVRLEWELADHENNEKTVILATYFESSRRKTSAWKITMRIIFDGVFISEDMKLYADFLE